MASAPGFPQLMTHPQHKPAVIADFSSADALPGSPERFPPIEVHSDDQEQEVRARGYLRYGEAMPKVVEFNEYPKIMSHPDHVDGRPATKASQMGDNGQLIIVDVPAVPEKLPNVTVRNADEEAEWEAKGYGAAGHFDAIAFERATLAPGKPGSEWPKWVDGVLTQDPDAPKDLSKDYPKWLHFDDAKSVMVNDPAHEARVLADRGETPAAEPTAAKAYVQPPVAAPRDAEYEEFLAWKQARAAGGGGILPTATPPADIQDTAGEQRLTTGTTPNDSEQRERDTLMALASERGIDVDGRWGVRRLREALAEAEAAE